MVRGLNVFKDYFGKHPDNYIIIGGTACERQFDERGLIFRATKDIDLILIIEALDSAFVEKFWEFIKDGGYKQTEVQREERRYYRFANPLAENFPAMIELFSRRPDVIKEIPGIHLTPIPVEDDLSSLSAILLDDIYYQFTISNMQLIDDLPVASPETLIALKSNAYLNMLQRKAEGDAIDSKNINKHKNDILRLAMTLTADSKITCHEKIQADIARCIELIRLDNPDTRNIFKEMGIGFVELEAILEQLRSTFLTP